MTKNNVTTTKRYETENGILAEEQAVVGRAMDDNSGTSGQGFYQYIGDDDQVYRVEYTVGEQGFIPKVFSLRIAYIFNRKNKKRNFCGVI